MTQKHVIAVDLGAESGRVMRASFDGGQITMTEVHRFPNIPVMAGGTLYWDVLRLWQDVTHGIQLARDGYEIASIGVDTWGVDQALLDNNGQLIGNVVHYRDSRTDGAMDWVFERVPRREVYDRTGIQFIQLNGLYQLAAMVRDKSSQLDAAKTLLSIADLFNYWLTGEKTAEFTMATTMQMVNPQTNDWDREMLAKLGMPTDILAPIVQPGTRIGSYEGIPVIAAACHDTASAVVGVPATTSDYAYLSSGTWSLIGLELDHAVTNDAAYEANMTNEGGFAGTFRFLRNNMGLWLAQQSRAIWAEQGHEYSYAELMELAQTGQPFRSLIEPDDDGFFNPEDMPQAIRDFCANSGQAVPEGHAQVIRCVYESLAIKYRLILDQQAAISGQPVNQLHVIGGGSRNSLLCQMAANASGRTVIAGPAEATALGNAMVQFISQGDLANLAEARTMLAKSLDTVTYVPQNTEAWAAPVERMQSLANMV